MIDPRLVRTFLAVCRQGSIVGAARWLNISQPSVSVSIGSLERALGTRLFERGRRGIALTRSGQALMRRAEMMEALLIDAEEAVALADQGIVGPLRIGGTPGALVSLLPSALAKMEPASGMAMHILERSDGQLTDLLRRGDIEVAFVTTAMDYPPEGIEERSVARDPFALIVGRAHDSLGPEVSLKQMARSGWVLPQAAGAFHRQIEALFLYAEAPMPMDVIRCDSLLTSKAIVGEGKRVTVLPRGVVAAELAIGSLRAIPISDVAITRSVGIRILAGRELSPAAAALVETLTAGFAQT